MHRLERIQRQWAAADASTPKFETAVLRTPAEAFAECEAIVSFALALNPDLHDGDGDLEEHLRVSRHLTRAKA